MQKQSILNLIKYYVEKDTNGFRDQAIAIARDFDKEGDEEIAAYIMTLLGGPKTHTFIPQAIRHNLHFLEEVRLDVNTFPIPLVLKNNLIGIIQTLDKKSSINKFLFIGKPGTGKTEAVKHLAHVTKNKLYQVNFNKIIDCKMGETQKNIAALFNEINSIAKIVSSFFVLFDEIDAVALDRTNENDLREMGRATTAVLKGLDQLDQRVVLFATTNLAKHIDRALTRRFDATINFDCYQMDDLQEIGKILANLYLKEMGISGSDYRLLKKIISVMDPVLSPGELKNNLRTAVAFSDKDIPNSYLKILFERICQPDQAQLEKWLKEQKFTVREIEILTNISKSQVSRNLRLKK